jgi:hypothetical protein
MSYRCGIGSTLAAVGGCEPSDPHILCDGCGAVVTIRRPPAWFLAGKPPRGWRGLRMADGSRRWDLCPRCWRGAEG